MRRLRYGTLPIALAGGGGGRYDLRPVKVDHLRVSPLGLFPAGVSVCTCDPCLPCCIFTRGILNIKPRLEVRARR